MTDYLPWIIALIIAAVLLGYFMGRRGTVTGAIAPAGRGSATPGTGTPGSGTLGNVMPGNTIPGGAVATRGSRALERPAKIAKPPASSEALSLASAQSWGYQLQNLDLKRAAASTFDMLVIDYSKDGSHEGALTPGEVERLKVKPDGSRRAVIAYCSIGEAESYRDYWQQGWKREKPAWLLGENPEWEENYAVCFWEAGWQEIVCGRANSLVDRIIAQGFDGIYLDKCDVTEDLREHFKAAARSRPSLDGDMVAFVRRISAHAKAKRPGFQIIMQNAEPLLEQPELRRAIDAVGKEELLYGLDRPEKPNTQEEIEWSQNLLEFMRRDGKPVFVVEYLSNPKRIAEATEAIRDLGYIPYIAPNDRELDRLNMAVLEV